MKDIYVKCVSPRCNFMSGPFSDQFFAEISARFHESCWFESFKTFDSGRHACYFTTTKPAEPIIVDRKMMEREEEK